MTSWKVFFGGGIGTEGVASVAMVVVLRLVVVWLVTRAHRASNVSYIVPPPTPFKARLSRVDSIDLVRLTPPFAKLDVRIDLFAGRLMHRALAICSLLTAGCSVGPGAEIPFEFDPDSGFNERGGPGGGILRPPPGGGSNNISLPPRDMGTGPSMAVRCLDETRCEISGTITEDTLLEASVNYTIVGPTFVEAPAELVLQPGTRVVADPNGIGFALSILPGARIDARGTPEAPIVFTSGAPEGERRAGEWGGLVLSGSAPVHEVGPDDAMRPFGGDDPQDDSGALSFMRVEFAGV